MKFVAIETGQPSLPTNQYFHQIISRQYLRLLGGRDRPIPLIPVDVDAFGPSRNLREGVPTPDFVKLQGIVG
jgi:hypothetical protein